MAKASINLEDKPLLTKALKEDRALAIEVIGTFTALMEEALEKGWTKLPKDIHRELKFGDLIRGVLRGSLDLKDINPDAFDTLGIEVHPLAILSPRKNYLEGGLRYFDWRGHFQLPEGTVVSEETVADIFRKMLRYTKYVNIKQLAQALESNQLATFRGIGDRNVELLPMMPAIRYQKEKFGDLYAGKLLDDNGFLDCGELIDVSHCAACKRTPLTVIGSYHCCYACNAGFKEKSL